MYQLVKGREATRTPRSAKARADLPEPVTKPINPWVVPEAPRRSSLERFGPAVACLLLIGLCSAAAWMSLTAPSPEGFRAAGGRRDACRGTRGLWRRRRRRTEAKCATGFAGRGWRGESGGGRWWRASPQPKDAGGYRAGVVLR